MPRFLSPMLLVPVCLVLGAGVARAEDGPYMWGIGPSLNTVVFPGRYPSKFATVAEDAGTLTKLRGDVGLGVRGVLYIDGANRLGARAMLGMGAEGYRAVSATAEYDRILLSSNNVGTFLGGGVGVGAQSFGTDAGASLSMTTYVLRTQVGAHYRDKSRAYELALFGQWNIPGEQSYVDAGAADPAEQVVTGGFYGQVGIEGTFYLGDFRPPKSE